MAYILRISSRKLCISLQIFIATTKISKIIKIRHIILPIPKIKTIPPPLQIQPINNPIKLTPRTLHPNSQQTQSNNPKILLLFPTQSTPQLPLPPPINSSTISIRYISIIKIYIDSITMFTCIKFILIITMFNI